MGMIRQAIGKKVSFSLAVKAFMIPFCIFAGSFGNVLVMTLRQQAVNVFLNVALRLLGILLGSVFYYSLISKSFNQTDTEINNVNDASNAADITQNESKTKFKLSFFNFLFGSAIILSLNLFLPGLLSIKSAKELLTVIMVLVLFSMAFSLFVIISGRLSVNANAAKDYAVIFADGIKSSLKRFPAFIFLVLLSDVSIAASIFLYELSWDFLKNTSLSSILSYFYAGSLVSCFSGFMLIVLIRTSIPIFSSEQTMGTGGNLVAGYLLMIVFIGGILYSIFPFGYNAEEIELEYIQIIDSAEKFRNEDKLYLCGSRYKSAYALTQAWTGYLTSRRTLLDKSISETEKSDLTAKVGGYMHTAYEFWPDGGPVLYLDAIRQMESNPSGSIALLEKSIDLEPDFVPAYFTLLDLYRRNNEKVKGALITSALIRKGSFTSSSGIVQPGIGTINKQLKNMIDREKLCLENITTSAVCLYENQLYQEAMEELNRLAQVIPDDLAVNYMIAVTDLEIKADGKPYKAALDASQKIFEQYPGEEWAEDFATGIAMRAGNQAIMEGSLQESYSKNPDNPDIAEQYAYSLLKKNTDFNYTDSAKQAEEIIDTIIAKESDRWFALYCKSVIQLFKKEYQNSLDTFEVFDAIISGDNELSRIYDDFYNLYVLKYRWMMSADVKASEVISTLEAENPFLFNYINGAYLWKRSDYDNGEKYLKAAIDLKADMSKPYFLLGNIYFEKAGANNLPEYYTMAEEQYRKSLVIFPEDPYAWFSLGHVLKKTNRQEEALGAFKKTLLYMPQEDHATDHFGISIHSYYQIQELNDLLKKEVK